MFRLRGLKKLENNNIYQAETTQIKKKIYFF